MKRKHLALAAALWLLPRGCGPAMSLTSGPGMRAKSFVSFVSFVTAFVACVAALVVPGPAWAAWLSANAASARATAGSVVRAAAPAAVKTGSAVTLSWAASALADGTPVTSYTVLRHAGATSTVVCTGTNPTRTCQDPSPLAGAVSYGVVPRIGTHWIGQESLLTTYAPDTTAPTSTLSTSPVANAAGWVNANTTVTITATDAGVGVASVKYAVNGGTTVTVSGSTVSFAVTAAGTTSISFWSVDTNGNTETAKPATVKLDKVAPGATISPVSSTTVWRSSGAVTVTGTDVGGSGVAAVVYTVDGGTAQTVGGASAGLTLAEGTHTIGYQAVDVAGNTSALQTATVKVDTGGPTLTNLDPANGDVFENDNTGSTSWAKSACATGRICVHLVDLGAGVDPAGLTFTLTRTSSLLDPCWTGSTFAIFTSCSVPLTYNATTGIASSANIPQTSMSDGTYRLVVTAKDLNGATSTLAVTFTAG